MKDLLDGGNKAWYITKCQYVQRFPGLCVFQDVVFLGANQRELRPEPKGTGGMRLLEHRDQEMSDLPFIHLKEGRWLMGLGVDRWRKLWEEVYQFKVAHWMCPKGIRVNLDSLLVAVYPFIAKDTTARALLAQQFMWKVVEQRQKEIEIRRDRRIEKERKLKQVEDDEGGS